MTTRRTRSKNIHTDLVRELRQRRSDGYGVMELAEHFGLSASSVSNVVNRRTHKNVLDLDDTPALPPLQTRFKPRTPVYHCAEGHLLKSKDAECVACVREATEAAKAKVAADAKAKVAADAEAKVAADAEAKVAADAKAKVAAGQRRSQQMPKLRSRQIIGRDWVGASKGMWLFKEHPMGDASHACCLRADTIAPQSSLECGRDTTGLAAAWGHKDLTDYRAQWLSRQVKLYQCRGLPPGPSGICAIIELNGQICAIFKAVISEIVRCLIVTTGGFRTSLAGTMTVATCCGFWMIKA